jgi:hypothetical protein
LPGTFLLNQAKMRFQLAFTSMCNFLRELLLGAHA